MKLEILYPALCCPTGVCGQQVRWIEKVTSAYPGRTGLQPYSLSSIGNAASTS